MTWAPKAANGTWYCERAEFRLPESFICRTEARAIVAALLLNALEAITVVTFVETDEGTEVCGKTGRPHILVRRDA